MNLKALCAFTLAILCALLIAATSSADAQAAGPQRQATLLIMIDGLGYDRVNETVSPNLYRLGETGVRAEMIPVWPTISSPNHYALVTGLYPIHSGLFHNEMLDPRSGALLDVIGVNPASGRMQQTSPREFWMPGEPIWASVAHRGGTSGMIGNWVGWMAEGKRPTWQIPYHPVHTESDARADLALSMLANEEYRTDLLTLFFIEVDEAQHLHGVGSPEANSAIAHVDAVVGNILRGLAERKLSDTVNVVIVSDHGQMNITSDRVIYLQDIIDPGSLETGKPVGGGPVTAIWPKAGKHEAIYQQLSKVAHVTAYRPGEIPARFNCCAPETMPPILLVADVGWSFDVRADKPRIGTFGGHGWDNQLPQIHSSFFAAGPAIKPGVHIQAFENVDVYPLLAVLLNVVPNKADGSIQSLCPILRAPPSSCRGLRPAKSE